MTTPLSKYLSFRRRDVVLVAKGVAKAVVVGALLTTLLVFTSVRGGSDSVPPVPANPYAPGLILDPTVTRPDPTITWDPEAHVYRMYTSQTLNGNTPEWIARDVTGPWKWSGDAVPSPPLWTSNYIWAPDVSKING